MKIELEQRSGINIATGQKQYYESYWVNLDGERVGAISWKEGASFLPRRPIDPIAMKAIRKKLEQALERQVTDKPEPPEIPEGMFDDEDEGKHYEDDFADP